MPIDDELESDDYFERSLVEDEWSESSAEFLDPATSLAVKGASKILDPLLRGMTRRTPFQRVRTGPGVGSARLNTPSGSAELRLPSNVPTIEQHKALEALVNAHSGRLNAVGKDLDSLRKQVVSVVADVTKQVSRVRQDQGNNTMMSLMMPMMAQQAQRDDLEGHTHGAGGAAVVPDDDGDMFMMLPMVLGMSGSSSGGESDNMMMLAMMMMMNRN